MIGKQNVMRFMIKLKHLRKKSFNTKNKQSINVVNPVVNPTKTSMQDSKSY